MPGLEVLVAETLNRGIQSISFETCVSLILESKSENPVSGSQVSSTSSDRSPTSYLQQQQQPQQQQHSERLRSTRESTSPRTGSSQEKDQQQQQSVPPKKSALNTSYSSEELLFQAASSLQGLEGKNSFSFPLKKNLD